MLTIVHKLQNEAMAVDIDKLQYTMPVSVNRILCSAPDSSN